MTQLDFIDLAAERQQRACTELARMVEANRRAPATICFREHRIAALKATRGG
jgi:hypothetical protein